MYIVIENAGYIGETERMIGEYSQAMAFIENNYSRREIEDLHVAIARIMPDGEVTFEV